MGEESKTRKDELNKLHCDGDGSIIRRVFCKSMTIWLDVCRGAAEETKLSGGWKSCSFYAFMPSLPGEDVT